MSSTLLELIRQNHETVERCELAIGEELDVKPSGQKPKVWQQHRLKETIDNICTRSRELKRLYEDVDGLLVDEVKSMRTTDINAFYQAVDRAKEYYSTFPNANAGPNDDVVVKVDVNFSGEEIFGKYLDLNPLHLEFCNIIKKANIEQDYLQYLDRFNKFFYLPNSVRSTRQFAEYLDHLWEYLVDFFKRTNPLSDWSKMENEFRHAFSSNAAGSGAGTNTSHAGSHSRAPKALRLGLYNSVEELEALGMEALKEGLEALGLKCGGTLRDRAERLFSVRGKKSEDIPAHLRAKGNKKCGPSAEGGKDTDFNSVAWKEYRVQALCEAMAGVVGATVKHAEKQQTRTAEEREAEVREEEFGLLPEVGAADDRAAKKRGGPGGDEEDEDAPVYNPLNLPLGWDGKPIPYWMYKLHGLGVEYKCQICGDHSYWGRRAFDKHFQEWRHAHGMRSLGIPNTKHFHDITQIDDALALYEKIKAEISVGQFQTDLEEEFEDTHGNVLNRRTYEDLARQGLL